ncbi:MAG: response regulator [Desulfobacter sp.]
MKRKRRITKTLVLGFGFLFLFFGLGGTFFFSRIDRLPGLNNTAPRYTLAISNTALECSLAIAKIQRAMRDIVLFPDPVLVAGQTERIHRYEATVYENLDMIRDRIPGDRGRALEQEVRQLFRAWQPLREKAVALALTRKGSPAPAAPPGAWAAHTDLIEAKMAELTAYAEKKALELLADAQRSRGNFRTLSMTFLVSGLLALLTVAGLILAFSSRFEWELVQTEHHLRNMFENAPMGMARFSSDGAIMDMNDKAAALLNAPGKTARGPAAALQFPRSMQAAIDQALAGRFAVYEDASALGGGKKTHFLRVMFNPEKPGAKKTNVIAAIEDVTERKQSEIKTKENEIRLNTIFNAVRAGIFVTDKQDMTLLDVNAAAEMMVGRPRPEMIGRPVARFISRENGKPGGNGDAPDNAGDMLLTAKHEKRPALRTATQVSIQGRECIVECVADISRQKEIEQELRQAKDAADADTRSKVAFLSNMSHEIRTPINGVVGMAELLADTALSPEQEDYVSTIEKSADALLEIINNILDHVSIDAGRVVLDTMEFNLRTLLESVADLTAARAQEKGLEYCTIIHPQTPCAVVGDPGRLRQVLLTLIENAVKFTPAGEVVIETRLKKEYRDKVTVRFIVSDTGIGISRNRIKTLFDSFAHPEVESNGEPCGTGLGLAISKQLIELMSGQIQVDSSEGKGSSFRFTVTLDKPPADKDVPPEAPEMDGQHLRGKHVLIVDDNATSRFVLKTDLTAWGCITDEALDGYMALEKLNAASSRGERFHIALIDMQMPKMDGEALGQAIKQIPAISRTRLVLLTAGGIRGDARRLSEIGFSGYLNKPVRQQDLFDCLNILYENRKKRQARTPLPIVTQHSIAETKPSKIRILLAEDSKLNQKVALGGLRKLGFSADAVANGKEALAALAASEYAVVLMDCEMPEMDGYEATRAIRSGRYEVKNPNIPVIAMTAHAMQKDRENCLAAGMSDYMAKPVKIKDLSAMLSKWLG